MKKVLFVLLPVFILCKIMVLSPSCANMIPPTGGPRDSLPPVLLSVTPPDSVKNFTGKRITFEFNEYVQVDNVQQNLLVSPTPIINPNIQTKLRTVTVLIRDTLEPNTTYTFDFGNAIRDINESNIFRNFSYIFSTGPTLDSLQLSGKVIVAETGGVDSTLIVMLHRNLDDSAVIKERPRYVTRLDSSGNFNFRNLPSGTFALYTLKDESGSRRYQSKTQLFGFADSAVSVPSSQSQITLFAYVEAPDTTGGTSSLLTPRPAATTAADTRLRLQTNLEEGQLSLLNDLEISFPQAPLRSFDSSMARLTNEIFEPVTGYSWMLDTSNKKITLKNNWVENTSYNLIFEKDFAEDTAGRKMLRNDTLSFLTKKTSDYGLVRLRFFNLELSRNPLLLFVQNNEVKYTHAFTNREFTSRLFIPGEYDLRIVYDENRNGKWDPGEFFDAHRQPEKVLVIPRRINIKANWDTEEDFTL